MKSEILNKLNQAFSQEQIKNRQGPKGKRLDYVETHAVRVKLNEALQADWSFEVVAHRITDTEVIVVAKITVHAEQEVIKTAFGSQRIKRYENNNEVICLGDDLKAAASDALKKASTLLGVGLHLYNRDGKKENFKFLQDKKYWPGQDTYSRPGHTQPRNNHSTQPRQHDLNSSSGNNGNGNGKIEIRNPEAPLTVNQMKAIFRIGKHSGMNNKAMCEMV